MIYVIQLNGVLLDQSNLPNVTIPIWNYDSVFKQKTSFQKTEQGRKRWNRYFGNWGDRGGPTEEEAFNAWFEMITQRYKKHTNKLKISQHPKYIIEKLKSIEENQFGYNAFGLQETVKLNLIEYIKGKKDKVINLQDI